MQRFDRMGATGRCLEKPGRAWTIFESVVKLPRDADLPVPAALTPL